MPKFRNTAENYAANEIIPGFINHGNEPFAGGTKTKTSYTNPFIRSIDGKINFYRAVLFV